MQTDFKNYVKFLNEFIWPQEGSRIISSKHKNDVFWFL
jgi:hypothetical protein